ncbi:hypothetical protein IV38_GL000616 [Lactobacillus selangorensis]|uniref:tRNA(Met) cytidine acetate ligase n=1 Tax=Lactobacillus selangorensis TaxID=81857 RepID=A0A0R2FMJ8_9LACO|nr:nucleotidyltransferase [Lactobacillus selangorensis]KRN29728.1 hypothetical protein IV38_GL000616 [Lactobacillus selangorensis]KRN33743.1 hypothetical protein IV40_GL000051 [Lactobacillus selangorensis]
MKHTKTDLTACGIIAEYNPFHNGHLYQLQTARKQSHADVMVALISGNYVERGEPAIVDKWQRAQLALRAGADLVIELPFADAVEPADRFATGAVRLLAALGCQSLAFGSEEPDADYAQLGQELAALPDLHAAFTDYTQTYATQLNQYYQEKLHLNISHANHLLGLSYATANARLQQPLQLIAVPRVGSAHDQAGAHDQFASASAIRTKLLAGDLAGLAAVVPPSTWQFLQVHSDWLTWDQLFPFLKYRIQSASLAELRRIYQMSEGLEYRFQQQIGASQTFAAFLKALKTKRYTYARLRRLCLYTLLNVTTSEMKQAYDQPYLQVLGFNQAGQAYLHQIKKTVTVPLVTRVDAKMGRADGLLGLEVRVDTLIQQLTGVPQDYGRHPIFKGKELE